MSNRSYTNQSEILNLKYRNLHPVFVHCHIDHFGFSHAHAFAPAESLHLNNNSDSYRGCPYSQRLRIKTNKVAHENGLVKDHFLHGHCDKAFHVRVTMGMNRAGSVDITQDNSTKN